MREPNSGGGQVVHDLVVDDGVASRGHRLGVFDSNWRLVGVRLAPHATFGYVCVINFAWAFFACREINIIRERINRGPFPMVPAKESKVETQWKALGVCVGCGIDIKGGGVVEGKGGMKWHKDCFLCCECMGSLVGGSYEEVSSRSRLLCD